MTARTALRIPSKDHAASLVRLPRFPPRSSSKDLGVEVVIEPNENRLAKFHRGCSQVSGWSKHQLDERFVVRAILLQVDPSDFFPFCDQERRHPFE